jgi:ABC-2 type transport system ATP-binding protein
VEQAPVAVSVSGLVKRYGRLVAVDGIDLVAGHGQVTAVLGPNGAGKTTTLEICEGFRTPDGGTARVLGLDPKRDATLLRPRVGVMLQSGGVYPSVSPRTALRHAARLYRHPIPPARLIDALGLGRVAGSAFRRLSGGEQQRTVLALALVGRPEVAFLDEPTAGLDPQSRRAVWDLVRGLREAGVAVVLTTHYLEEAEELADEVVIVDRGRVVASGTPRALTDGGEEHLVFEGPPRLPIASLQPALPGGSVVTEVAPGRYRLSGPVEPQLLVAVTTWCAQLGVVPERLRTHRRSLEDVFLELTGQELRP